MANCKNPNLAREYLKSHNYSEVRVLEDTQRISFRDKSGDGTWENGIAAENDWSREELGTCCFNSMRLPLQANNYCCECGIGINGITTWKTDDETLDKEVLKEMLEFPKIK